VTIPVILTLEDEEAFDVAEETDYVGWSHSRIYQIISYVVRQREDRIPEDAKIFIEHYLTTLRRITMQDKEIAELCKQIYRRHKDAIDLIVEYGTTNQFDLAAESFMSKHKDLQQLFLNPRRLWFVHKEWERYMPPCSDRWKFLSKPYPVACWFRFGSQKVGYIIEVGSMEHTEKRMELIKAFDSKGFRVGKKSYRPESKYTRVHTVYRKIEDPDDEEIIEKQLNELWDKSHDKFKMVGQIIKKFKWE